MPAHTTAAGVPAKILGVATEGRPSELVDQNLRHVIFDKGSNGNNHGLSDKKSNGRPSASSAGGAGAGVRRDSSAAAGRRTVGVRRIDKLVNLRSFL